MNTKGWIDFRYKLPYSAIEGRTPPYDFPVLVAVKRGGTIMYITGTARGITKRYKNDPINYLAWLPIEEYDGPRG